MQGECRCGLREVLCKCISGMQSKLLLFWGELEALELS